MDPGDSADSIPRGNSSSPSTSTRHVVAREIETDRDQLESLHLSFPKHRKRKRLAKACDACHKSKRRCDGTAPCSNCYFASKQCSYTDASGRPVPAPKASESLLQRPKDDRRSTRDYQPITSFPLVDTDQSQLTASSSKPLFNLYSERSTDSMNRAEENPFASKQERYLSILNGCPAGLEPNLLRELVNLFFAHCHPIQLIIHKPSFMASLSRSRVPQHLILALCATSAPFSLSAELKTSPPRMAGLRFHEEAVNMMFDSEGRLVCEPDLYTVQTLCLLEVHDINARWAWTKNFKYQELASKILVETLDVHSVDKTVNGTSIERECIRRCYWLIYFSDVLCNTLTRRPTRFPSTHVCLRLPIDETSFELGIQTSTPEFLNLSNGNESCLSEFGHIVRILVLFSQAEDYLASADDEVQRQGLIEIDLGLEEWRASLPDHLWFTQENLDIQHSMFETSSCGGAWCFFFMHVLYAVCILSSKAKSEQCDTGLPEYVRMKEYIGMIMSSIGKRRKLYNWLIAAFLWPLSRYCTDDPDMLALDAEFELTWGFRCLEIAPSWRKNNKMIRTTELVPVPGTEQRQPPHQTIMNQMTFVSEERLPRTAEARRREGPGFSGAIETRDNKDERQSLPSLKAVGLLDSFQNRLG